MSNSPIPITSKQSPRFENGTWKWYVGNTFGIKFTINIEGLPSSVQNLNKYSIDVEFYNDKENLVHRFHFTKDDFGTVTPTSGKFSPEITLQFDKNITKKFSWGKYAYCIKLNELSSPTSIIIIDTATIYGEGKAEVELCH